MKNILFGIFAHPDDEAFGPSATLYKMAHSGTDVHLILVTDGEAGRNSDHVSNLAEVRLAEWQKSGQLIGVSSGKALHYPDGGLSNDLYLKVAAQIMKHVNSILSGYTEALTISFMTFENSGISGHLDHIAVSYITTYVYKKLQNKGTPNHTFGPLRYFCLPKSIAPKAIIDWLYMPAGKKVEEIDEVVSYPELAAQKHAIMRAHHSQREDMEQILLRHQDTQEDLVLCDYFSYFKD